MQSKGKHVGLFTCESHIIISRVAFWTSEVECVCGGGGGGGLVGRELVMNIFICILQCPVKLKCHACVVLMYAI